MAALLELMMYNNEFLLDSGGDFILYDDGAGLNCCCEVCVCDCPELLTKLSSTTSGMSVRIQIPCLSVDVTEGLTNTGSIPNVCASLATTVVSISDMPSDIKFEIGCKDGLVTARFTHSGGSNCEPDNDDFTIAVNVCDPLEIEMEFGIQQGTGPLDPCSCAPPNASGQKITVTLIP